MNVNTSVKTTKQEHLPEISIPDEAAMKSTSIKTDQVSAAPKSRQVTVEASRMPAPKLVTIDQPDSYFEKIEKREQEKMTPTPKQPVYNFFS